MTGADPVKFGLVASVNRPGGNVTGVTNVSGALAAKRLELLHKLVPNATRIAVLVDPSSPTADIQTSDLQEAARVIGLHVDFLKASTEGDLDTAFGTLVRQQAGALLLADSPFFNYQLEHLVSLAARHGIPAAYTFREFAAAGGLMSYAASLVDLYRQMRIYVGRILRGAKPAELPVLQPTKFVLVINLKAAKAFGIEVPATLLALADEVIE